jgi:hypothetical protein
MQKVFPRLLGSDRPRHLAYVATAGIDVTEAVRETQRRFDVVSMKAPEGRAQGPVTVIVSMPQSPRHLLELFGTRAGS